MITIDSLSFLAGAPATLKMEELCQALEQRGLWLGDLSPRAREQTLAGWIEGPWASLKAVPGGRLETAAVSLEAELPGGESYGSQTAPRSATGPDLDALFLGAGGALGRLRRATLRCFPRPIERIRFATPAPNETELVSKLRRAVLNGAWLQSARIRRRSGLRVQIEAAGPQGEAQAAVARAARAFGVEPVHAAEPLPPLSARSEWELSWEALPAFLASAGEADLYRLARESLVAAITGEPKPVEGAVRLDAPKPIDATLAAISRALSEEAR